MPAARGYLRADVDAAKSESLHPEADQREDSEGMPFIGRLRAIFSWRSALDIPARWSGSVGYWF